MGEPLREPLRLRLSMRMAAGRTADGDADPPNCRGCGVSGDIEASDIGETESSDMVGEPGGTCGSGETDIAGELPPLRLRRRLRLRLRLLRLRLLLRLPLRLPLRLRLRLRLRLPWELLLLRLRLPLALLPWELLLLLRLRVPFHVVCSRHCALCSLCAVRRTGCTFAGLRAEPGCESDLAASSAAPSGELATPIR